MGQIERNCVLMQNWMAWNRTVLTFNCEWIRTIQILNWIVWNKTTHVKRNVWNRTDYLDKNRFGVK